MELSGAVKYGEVSKGQRKIYVEGDEGEKREYSLPRGVHVNVQEGERVKAGEPLMDGPRNPHDILDVLGEKELQKDLVKNSYYKEDFNEGLMASASCGPLNDSNGYYTIYGTHYDWAENWAGMSELASTKRHEYDSTTQSHWAFYSASFSKNNPYAYTESQVAPPSTSSDAFNNSTINGIDNLFTQINTDGQQEPYGIGYTENNILVGYANFGPNYGTCQ